MLPDRLLSRKRAALFFSRLKTCSGPSFVSRRIWARGRARIHGNIEHPTPIKRERASNAQRRSEGGRGNNSMFDACSRDSGVECLLGRSGVGCSMFSGCVSASPARDTDLVACSRLRSLSELAFLAAPTCRAKAQRRRAPAMREKAEGVQFQPRRGGIFVVERQKTIPAPSRLHFVSARSRRSRRRRRTGAASRFRPDGAGDF